MYTFFPLRNVFHVFVLTFRQLLNHACARVGPEVEPIKKVNFIFIRGYY